MIVLHLEATNFNCFLWDPLLWCVLINFHITVNFGNSKFWNQNVFLQKYSSLKNQNNNKYLNFWGIDSSSVDRISIKPEFTERSSMFLVGNKICYLCKNISHRSHAVKTNLVICVGFLCKVTQSTYTTHTGCPKNNAQCLI